MCLLLGHVEGNSHRVESRRLGNKTKMIQLMSKVGNRGLNILTPPLKPDFMSKYQKNIGPGNKV